MGINERRAIYHPLFTNTTFPGDQYSLMKHGCVTSQHYFSAIFSQFILDHIDQHKHYILLSSSYLSVPNAANQLVETMLPQLGSRFKRSMLQRRRVASVDFATLTRQQRLSYTHYLEFDYVLSELQGQSVIVVDDAYVTGMHERAIRDRLQSVVGDIQFFYLLDLSGHKEAVLESDINQIAVRNLLDVLPLRHHPEFRYNTRVLKLLLHAVDEDFISYLSILPSSELTLIAQHCASEGFDELNDHFKSRLQRLQHQISCREKAGAGVDFRSSGNFGSLHSNHNLALSIGDGLMT